MLRHPLSPATTLWPLQVQTRRTPVFNLATIPSLPPPPPGKGNPWAVVSSTTLPGLSDTLAGANWAHGKGDQRLPWHVTNTAVMASVHRLPEGGASQEQRSSPPRVLHPFLLWWDPLPVVLLPFLPLFFFFLNLFCPYCPLSLPQFPSHYRTAWAKNTSGSRDQAQTKARCRFNEASMETRFLLPGRRMCLRQGKGAGREACGEEMEMLVRWEQ